MFSIFIQTATVPVFHLQCTNKSCLIWSSFRIFFYQRCKRMILFCYLTFPPLPHYLTVQNIMNGKLGINQKILGHKSQKNNPIKVSSKYVHQWCDITVTSTQLHFHDILFNSFRGVVLASSTFNNCQSKFKKGKIPRNIMEVELSPNMHINQLHVRP